jgi:NAD(P)-dependent dehydrogenase (short-subunit alcohol dehydrogenase family)
LVRAGANLVVTDVDARACDALRDELHTLDAPGRVTSFVSDVTNPEQLVALRDHALAEHRSIDVLINNAAIDDKFADAPDALELSRFENTRLSTWQRALEVNVTGPFLCCQILGTVMAQQGKGSIVNIASTYGLVAPQQSLYRTPEGRQAFFKGAAYPVTKHALIGLTRYLAAYWGSSGVRVNALCPGGVEQGQSDFFVQQYAERTPLRRMARPTDYREAIVFLASDASAYMTGANLVMDGGYTIW